MTANYFSLLNLPPAFDLDLKALEAAYFAAQRQYHPDRFVGKPAQERMAAAQRSADINQAYNALKNPLKRAQYLLHLQGIEVGTEADTMKPEMALLTEVMAWRETLEEIVTPNELNATTASLHEIENRLLIDMLESYTNLQWDRFAQQTIRLGYMQKILDQIQKNKRNS